MTNPTTLLFLSLVFSGVVSIFTTSVIDVLIGRRIVIARERGKRDGSLWFLGSLSSVVNFIVPIIVFTCVCKAFGL